MSLRARFSDLLDRVTYATAHTVGKEWDDSKRELLAEIDELEARLQRIEAHPALAAPQIDPAPVDKRKGKRA